MNPSTIKAHVASLLQLPLSQVILKQVPGKTPNFEKRGDNFYIEYDDPKTLVHEFLHSCFTPNVANKNLLFNALEDFRISQKAAQYDKQLAYANDSIYTDKQYTDITESIDIEDPDLKRTRQIVSLMATPRHVDIKPTMDKIGFEEHLQNIILDSKDSIAAHPTFDNMTRSYDRLEGYCTFEEKQGRPRAIGDYHTSNPGEAKQSIASNLKERTYRRDIPKLASNEEFILQKAIRAIIQNKSIGKRNYTITGKLKTKRLGRMPSNYLFQKKTNPHPETKLYVLGDCSGSMYEDRIITVLKFFNSIRSVEIPNFKLELRMFNSLMFSNDEIPMDWDVFHSSLMEASYTGDAGGSLCTYNDDAHFLHEIIKQIQTDPTPNKALLILSDGAPAPTHDYHEESLPDIVNTELIPSGIPYMSIGIESESVQRFYPKYKVCWDTKSLVDTLYTNTKLLINN